MSCVRYIFVSCLLAWLGGGSMAMGETYQGFEGCWLRNGAMEAFVSAKPLPRVLAIRRPGGESPLFVTKDFGLIGIRSRYHEPDRPAGQPDTSMAPADQPAELTQPDKLSAALTAAADRDASGLQLTMEVRLDKKLPVLTIVHRFTNLREEKRRLAAWAILAVPGRGSGVLPYADGSFSHRLIQFRGLSPEQPVVSYGVKALRVDYGTAPKQIWYKVGTNSAAGWVVYLTPEMTVRSTVAVTAGAEYPEDGATVTAFVWRGGGGWQEQPFGEIEHNGALTEVEPGGTLELTQRVELLPAVDADSGPDAVRERVEALKSEPVESPALP